MKIIAYSDLHVHPHRFGAGTDDDTGRQSRLQDCLDVLDMTAKAVKEHGAVARFFCGDMFHVRGRIQPSVFNPVLSHFKSVHNPNNFTDYMLVGNHDMEHRANGEHAVHGLRGPGVDVLEGSGTMLDDWGRSVLIGWVSYTPDIRELKERVRKVAYDARHEDEHVYRRIFMLHHGVDGAMPSIPDMGFGVTDLPHEDFDLILCGDYHMHKELIPGRAWMIGAPLQHTFGDAGQKRGYMVIDLGTMQVEHVENTAAPKFVTWDATSAFSVPPTDLAGNFVRIRAMDKDALDKCAEEATRAGAAAVQLELVRSIEAIERADMALSMTTAQMFAAWLEKQEVAKDDVEKLILLNDDLLKEVGIG